MQHSISNIIKANPDRAYSRETHLRHGHPHPTRRARDARPPPRCAVTSAGTAACRERALELRGEWRRARHRQLATLAIPLFCHSAARRCLRCQPPRPVAGAVTWCAVTWCAHDINTRATHTTPQCERRRARHRQALPRLRCRAHPLRFARSVRGGRCRCTMRCMVT